MSAVSGSRDYGSPENNFQTIADFWSVYKGVKFSASDVAMMMALLKVARIKSGGGTEDSFVDLAGYAACGGELVTEVPTKCAQTACTSRMVIFRTPHGRAKEAVMKLNTDSFVGVGICILGLLGVGYAIGVHSKMKTVCEKLDTSIDRLANDTEVDIPAKVIDQAVQRAVDRESYSAVKRATDEVMDDVKREIESRVGAAVKEHYDAISDGVTDQIAKNVAKIDESRLRKEVVQKAKEQIAEKFDDKLDDILEEFNGNPPKRRKIYKSIAKSFSKEDI